MGELAGYEDEKQIQRPACVTEIVQREYLEHQQFQGINVGNVKRKAEQNKTIPAVQVSYPQQKIGNNQRNTVSSEAKNKAHFTWGKK